MIVGRDDFLERVHLKNKQRRINEMFEEEGLTDEILKKQIELNQERHKLDIHDSTETLHVDKDGKVFVQ